MENPLKPNRFTAYKVSTEGNQTRWGYIHNLTKQEINELPFGRLTDNVGPYTWGYGINEGNKI